MNTHLTVLITTVITIILFVLVFKLRNRAEEVTNHFGTFSLAGIISVAFGVGLVYFTQFVIVSKDFGIIIDNAHFVIFVVLLVLTFVLGGIQFFVNFDAGFPFTGTSLILGAGIGFIIFDQLYWPLIVASATCVLSTASQWISVNMVPKN